MTGSDIADDAADLLAAGRRIPQEALRYDLLIADTAWATPDSVHGQPLAPNP